MIFKLPGLWLHLDRPTLFAAGRVQHGPRTWPWWRLFAIAIAATNPGRQNPLAPAWNVWVYTRHGAAVVWCCADRVGPRERVRRVRLFCMHYRIARTYASRSSAALTAWRFSRL